MKSDGEVKIKINVDDGNSPKIIKGLDESLKDLQGSGDQAGDSMGKMGNQTDNAEGSAKKATNTFKTSTTALVAAKVATTALETAKASMDRAFGRLDTMENFERTLLRIYDGNQKTVDQILASTNDVVSGTAYALDTAANHVQGFIVSGKRQWEQAASDVGIWGDAVAFYGDGSSEQFDRVLKDLVSMSSKGVIRMGDLTNAVAAGIPVYDIYAQATGQTVEEVQKSFTAGQVSAEEFLDVMNASFSEGVDGFVAIEGAAKEAGGSWSNTFGNFATAVARGTASIISDLDDAFGETRWGSIRDNVSRSGKLFESVLKSVGNVLSSTVVFVDKYAEAILGVIAAFGAYKVVSKFQAVLQAVSKAKMMNLMATKSLAVAIAKTNKEMTLGQIAVSALTGKMKISTGVILAKAKANAVLAKSKALLNPQMWAFYAVVGLVTAGIRLWTKKKRETTEEEKKMAKEISNTTSNMERLSSTVDDSQKSFEDNSTAVMANRNANYKLIKELENLEGVERKSAVEKEKMAIMVEQLNGSMEDLNLELDKETGLLNMSREELIEKNKAYAAQEQSVLVQDRLVEALREEAEIDLELEKIIRQRAELDLLTEQEGSNKKEMKKLNAELTETEEQLEEAKKRLGSEQRALEGILEESLENMAADTEDSVDRQITSWEELVDAHHDVAERMKETYKMFADVATTSDKKVFDSQDLLVQKTDKNGKAIADSYYSLEESIRQSIENVLEIKEHNIRVAEEWGTNLGIISENACDSVVDEMMRMAQESPEMAYLMVEASEEQFERFEEIARARSEAASNAMNNQLGEGYEDVVALTQEWMGFELPETLIQLLNDAGFGEAGAQIPDDVADGMTDNEGAVTEASGNLLTNTLDFFNKRLGGGDYKDAGKTLPEELGDGIELAGPWVANSTAGVVQKADDELKELEPKFNSAGGDAMLGLASGLTDNEGTATAAASDVAGGVFKSFKSMFQIHSPSRLMRDQIGKPIVEGIAVGIDKNSDLIDRSLKNLNKDMLESTKKGAEEVVKTFDDMGNNLEKSLNRWPSFTKTALVAVNQILQTEMKKSDRIVKSGVAEMTKAMNQLIPDFRDTGQNAMKGLNQGLLNGRAQVMNTARSIANDVARTMQKALDINSPSRVMRDEVGKWIPYGIAEGIDSHADKALNSASDLGRQMIKLPNISDEAILEGRLGHLGSPQPHSTTIINQSQSKHYDDAVIRDLLKEIRDNIGGDVYIGEDRVGEVADRKLGQRATLSGRRLAQW